MSTISRRTVYRRVFPIMLAASLSVLAVERVAGQPEGTETAKPKTAVSDSRAKNNDLEPHPFERLHKLIKPHPAEWRFMQISWATSVGEARQRAAREGKPMLIWYMEGEPLGQC